MQPSVLERCCKLITYVYCCNNYCKLHTYTYTIHTHTYVCIQIASPQMLCTVQGEVLLTNCATLELHLICAALE